MIIRDGTPGRLTVTASLRCDACAKTGADYTLKPTKMEND